MRFRRQLPRDWREPALRVAILLRLGVLVNRSRSGSDVPVPGLTVTKDSLHLEFDADLACRQPADSGGPQAGAETPEDSGLRPELQLGLAPIRASSDTRRRAGSRAMRPSLPANCRFAPTPVRGQATRMRQPLPIQDPGREQPWMQLRLSTRGSGFGHECGVMRAAAADVQTRTVGRRGPDGVAQALRR